MSHHSDDILLSPNTDSFWEPGNYKKTTKRIEDGFRLCNDLCQLIQDRADIEKSYAKSLRNWSKKWTEAVEKGPEYGTMEAAWKGILGEADRLHEMHIKIKDSLCCEIQQKIKDWQKETYHKSMIQMQLKERKEAEDNFKKAQKPWAKLLARVHKARSDYHTACRNERTAVNHEKNASSDTSLSSDQVKKLQDRVQRAREDVARCREKYDSGLRELSDYTPRYMEDMRLEFDKCQQAEGDRMAFFKEILLNVHHCLNLSDSDEFPELTQIYEELLHTINNADSDKDLRWWSNTHGANMHMNWPQFEEYSEEFRDITRSKKSQMIENSITLLNQRTVGEDLPDYSKIVKKDNNDTSALNSVSSNNFVKQEIKGKDSKSVTVPPNGVRPENPFEEEDEWDEYTHEVLIDNGEPGIPVRALFDYVGAESDELSFKTGDIFEKLEDEDEQGWCKGRKEGRVGLYPANYVEVVNY